MIEVCAGCDFAFFLFGLVWDEGRVSLHLGPLAVIFRKVDK